MIKDDGTRAPPPTVIQLWKSPHQIFESRDGEVGHDERPILLSGGVKVFESSHCL